MLHLYDTSSTQLFDKFRLNILSFLGQNIKKFTNFYRLCRYHVECSFAFSIHRQSSMTLQTKRRNEAIFSLCTEQTCINNVSQIKLNSCHGNAHHIREEGKQNCCFCRFLRNKKKLFIIQICPLCNRLFQRKRIVFFFPFKYNVNVRKYGEVHYTIHICNMLLWGIDKNKLSELHP